MKSLPPSKINSTKLLGGSSFSTKKTSGSLNKLNPEGENDFSIIKKQVFEIKNLVTNITLSKKNEQKIKQKEQEQEKFEGTEKKLEKKKPKETGIKLPSTPKLGFLDRIKNFLFNTFLGFIAVRLIEHLPKLIGVAKFLGGTLDFLTSVGGTLLNGLVTFVEKGYEVADFTRKQLRNFGGEGAVEKFDALNKAFENIIFAAIAASLALGNLGSGGDKSGGPGGKPARRGLDTTGRRVSVNTQKRFAEKYGRDEFIKRFGKENLKNLPKSMQRSALTKFGRKAVVGALGKGGTKTALKVVAPLVRNIPLIGGIMEFVLSWMSGDPVGKAAFKGVGAGLGTWIGGALGSLIPIPGVGTAIGMWLGSAGGSKLGEVIYDKIFNSKDSPQKPQESIKAKGGGLVPSTRGGKSVSSAPTRTLKKKKKSTRSLSFIPTKIKPGKSAGGEDKIQSVFPNPEKEWWDPLGVFSGKTQEEPQQKKSTEKVSNPQEFLLESNDVLGKSNFFGPFFTLALKSVLGDKPNKLDYLKVGQGLNSWMQTVFKTGPLGFAGGGEVDVKQFFGGEDYTQVIAKSVEDSVYREIDTTIRNLRDELSLKRPVGKEEMTQENIRKGTEGDEGGGSSEGGISGSGVDKAVSVAKKLIADLGITPAQASGIVGNFLYESAGMNPGEREGAPYGTPEKPPAMGTLRQGYGWAQWTNSAPGDRLDKFLKSYGGDKGKIATDDDNYRFLMKELKGSESLTKKGVITGTFFPKDDPQAASDWFRQNWERAGVPADEKRRKETLAVFNKIKGLSREQAKLDVEKSGGKIYSGETSSASGSSKFIQGNSGASKGIHFHIGPGTQPGAVDTKYNADAREAGKRVVKHFLGKKSLHDGRREVNYTSGSDNEIMAAQRAHSASGSQGGVDIQVGGAYDPGAKLPFPFAVSNMAYRTGGFGVSAKINGLNAFVAHGRYDEKGKIAKQELGPNLYALRGMNKLMTKDAILKVHKGEFVSVIDKPAVDLFGMDFVDSINRIENKSQLKNEADSLINTISHIAGYEPGGQQEVVVEQPEPEIVYITTPSPTGGGAMAMGGSSGGSNFAEELYERG